MLFLNRLHFLQFLQSHSIGLNLAKVPQEFQGQNEMRDNTAHHIFQALFESAQSLLYHNSSHRYKNLDIDNHLKTGLFLGVCRQWTSPARVLRQYAECNK